MISHKNIIIVVTAWMLALSMSMHASSPRRAYDIDMAEDICKDLPLENVEGIWLYPEDKVTVMILKDEDNNNPNIFPTYSITVVETSDAKLHPGEKIGSLTQTPQDNVFKIDLLTEKKKELLLKPRSVVATLSKEGDSFIFKKQKMPFRGRLNFNFNRLLPGFWKIISTGINKNNNNTVSAPVGMIKIYPSYDGNGSSRRKIRYL